MPYLLLMRHGAYKDEIVAGGQSRRTLTADTKAQIADVARALDEYITETSALPQLKLELSQIWHADTPEATKTAEHLKLHLAKADKIDLAEESSLSPRKTSPYGPARNLEPLVAEIAKFLQLDAQTDVPQDDSKRCRSLIVVGHQPLLGWIAEKFAGEAYPIHRTELLCLDCSGCNRFRRWLQRYWLRVGRGAVLRWVLTPSDVSDTLNELKEKIRGKMEGAKLLGTFSTAIVTFILGTVIDTKKLAPLGQGSFLIYAAAMAFLLATLLYFASYYAYDRLLMPVRFWGEPSPKPGSRHPHWLVTRPPSSSAWVLYQNMIHVWSWLFTPAVVLVCAGLALLTLAVLWRQSPALWYGTMIAIVVLAALFKWLYRMLGPRLGSQD